MGVFPSIVRLPGCHAKSQVPGPKSLVMSSRRHVSFHLWDSGISVTSVSSVSEGLETPKHGHLMTAFGEPGVWSRSTNRAMASLPVQRAEV